MAWYVSVKYLSSLFVLVGTLAVTEASNSEGSRSHCFLVYPLKNFSYNSRPTLLTTTSSEVTTLLTFSALAAKKSSTWSELRLSPYIWLIVLRLMGIGTSCPSTLAKTLCSYCLHLVNWLKYSNTSLELV